MSEHATLEWSLDREGRFLHRGSYFSLVNCGPGRPARRGMLLSGHSGHPGVSVVRCAVEIH